MEAAQDRGPLCPRARRESKKEKPHPGQKGEQERQGQGETFNSKNWKNGVGGGKSRRAKTNGRKAEKKKSDFVWHALEREKKGDLWDTLGGGRSRRETKETIGPQGLANMLNRRNTTNGKKTISSLSINLATDQGKVGTKAGRIQRKLKEKKNRSRKASGGRK